jgi:hypothetical protein
MHPVGKVLAILVVFAAIGASVLTAKLVQVRNSWTAKSVASKNKYLNDLQPKIESLETQITALKSEIFRSRDLWGYVWNGVPTNVANPDGTLQINIGTASGIRDKLLLHGFEIAADGTSIYRGSFLAIEPQNGNATLKPNWRIAPEDVRTWQSGNWRWRNMIPSGYQENIDRQLTAILKHEETLSDRRLTLAKQNELLAEANQQLKVREAELLGGAELGKAASVESEYRDGLVSAVTDVEEGRNEKLRQIDELRRTVRKIQADIERTRDENIELVRRLPQSGSREDVTQKK